MATALTPSSNNKQWWLRLSANKEPPSYPPASNLYSDIPAYIGRPPHTESGASRHLFMTSVTNPTPTSPNAFTVSSKPSSRFNLAAVIGFGSRSKKQQPVDIQDPPEHVHSLLASTPNATKEFSVSPQLPTSPDPALSRGLVSSGSATSTASTDGPLTPADDTPSPGPRTSYQQSLMTLTDIDPFSSTVPLNDHRSSAHSDKSLSRRLMQKLDGKSAKTNSRLPTGDGLKETRERSATLPARVRTSGDPSEAYQPLQAVEAPWATSDQSETHPMTSPRVPGDHSKPARGVFSGTTLRHSKSSKAALPWPQTQAAKERGSSRSHQRKDSSSSISKEPLTDVRRTHTTRPSTSSSIQVSPISTTFHSQLSVNHSRPRSGSEQSGDVRHTVIPSLSATSSANTLPILPTHARTSPRPPPTAGLPSTPTSPKISGSSSPSRLYVLSSPFAEHHPLRSRSGTAASASSVSFASSLSSLSFNSRPSPQEPPVSGAPGAYDYPSLLNETLPVPGEANDAVPRRGNNSRSSTGLHKDSKGKGLAFPPTNDSTRNDHMPKLAKSPLSGSRPLPIPPGILPSGIISIRRERALSAVGSSSDAGKALRKQRSFHNTSHNAPGPLTPTLRHYNSFDPSIAPVTEGQVRSLPSPPLGSPSLSSLQDSSPLPPPPTTIAKRASAGKDSATSPSPRRKLFGANKHDRDKERERKLELDHVDTTISQSASSTGLAHSSSSWFDDRGTSSEPASASSASPSIAHEVAQHIVPPAELLRLGAAWERENEGRNGLRRTKSSWGSRDSDISRMSAGSSSSKTPIHPSAPRGSPPTPDSGSKLPRSTSLLSKASSAPSFSRARGSPPDLSFAPSSSPLPPESYTSLSPPPPRRQHRSISRVSPPNPSGSPLSPGRTPSTMSSRSMPPKGALIERKPSFLDMTTTRQSVTLVVPEFAPSDCEVYERDSFLELSRGMDSIDTIRESISSVDSFME